MDAGADLKRKAEALADAALERKAWDIVALDVRELSSFTDAFVLATGGSPRQVRAIADNVLARAKACALERLNLEGYDEGNWVLIDLNEAVVHVFLAETREHYELERLWGEAPRLFESEDRKARNAELGA